MNDHFGNKEAAGPVAPSRPVLNLTPEQLEELQNPAITTNGEALRQVAKIGLLGLGVGAGTRAITGIRDLFNRPAYTPPKIGPRPAVIEVNVPETPEEAEEQRKLRRKMAADAPAAPPELPPRPGRLVDSVDTPQGPIDPPVPYVPGFNKPWGQGIVDYFLGKDHIKPTAKPWFMPAAVGAGMLGLYGGWKGIGAISDWHHSSARKRELEDAKREYRNALVEQFNADKRASTNPAAELDRLASRVVKHATAVNDMAGTALGGYLTLAGLLAAGSGMATYNYVKSRVPENRLAKAIKQRERLRWAARPPEIYAVSKPSLAPEPTTALEDEDAQTSDREEMMDRSPLRSRKLASLYKD